MKEKIKRILDIAKGAAIGTAKDLTGLRGAAGEKVRPIAKKMMTDTGYMIGRVGKKIANKMWDFIEGPKKDFTGWNENIKKGKPEDNLK